MYKHTLSTAHTPYTHKHFVEVFFLLALFLYLTIAISLAQSLASTLLLCVTFLYGSRVLFSPFFPSLVRSFVMSLSHTQSWWKYIMGDNFQQEYWNQSTKGIRESVEKTSVKKTMYGDAETETGLKQWQSIKSNKSCSGFQTYTFLFMCRIQTVWCVYVYIHQVGLIARMTTNGITILFLSSLLLPLLSLPSKLDDNDNLRTFIIYSDFRRVGGEIRLMQFENGKQLLFWQFHWMRANVHRTFYRYIVRDFFFLRSLNTHIGNWNSNRQIKLKWERDEKRYEEKNELK